MTSVQARRTWANILTFLAERIPDWQEKIKGLGQTAAAEKRLNQGAFTDSDVLEALIRAVLSNSTDWIKIERVLPEFNELFKEFDLAWYSGLSEDYIDQVVLPWFTKRKAGSMPMARDLKNLVKAANILRQHNGSADSYFLEVIGAANSNLFDAVMLLGKPGSRYKLPALGIPIAAESMRNLGYELAKPDRHICRALGCFELVKYKNWNDRSGTKSPIASAQELYESMCAMDKFAHDVKESPTYVDNVIWLLCAKMGAYVSNGELVNLANKPALLKREPGLSNSNKISVLANALTDIAKGDHKSASDRITAGYPFEPMSTSKRSWTQRRALSIFLRDGFVDRYSGERLVYPGALRLLTLYVPSVFPAHPNWKMSETHIAYWELFPTLDHVLPVARGGADNEDNLVTTSMQRNQAKSSWTLDELDWKLHPAGNQSDWDGLLVMVSKLINERPELLEDKYLSGWHCAAQSIEAIRSTMQPG